MTENSLPYCYLAIPHEMLTEDFLNDPIMIRFVVWMMKRIRSKPIQIPIKNQHKQLLLEPFEFMFGRYSCPKDANISVRNARTRLAQLIGLGYVEKVTSKSTSHYSIYRLLTKAFRQNPGHLDGHEKIHQGDQLLGHKRETKIKEDKDIKGTFNDTGKADRTFLSEKQQEDLIVLQAYFESNDLRIYESSLTRWICKYDISRITSNIALLVARKKLIKKHEAWMETALRDNYSQKNMYIECNREFIKKFKEANEWKDMRINKAYCTHTQSGKDYQFNLPPENFSRMIVECFEQYCKQ
jgi:hypothetical protein